MCRLLGLVISCALMMSAQSVQYVAEKKIFLLTTKQSSYATGVSSDRQLQHLYWGGPLWRADDLKPATQKQDISSFDPHQMLDAEEYPGWGGARYYEPALKITRADGDRDLVLHYKSHKIDGDRLEITMKDINDDVEAQLEYHVYPEFGIISRKSTVRNNSKQAITIESAQSATWNLPEGDGYRLSYLIGRWAAETQLNHEPIHEGMKVLESRLGETGHNVNPWFAIDEGHADEEHGRVWFGALAWSGNWRITVEQTPYKQVRVTGGFNPFDFAWPLKPGEALETPDFYAGYSGHGFGEASHMLHDLERSEAKGLGMDFGLSFEPEMVNRDSDLYRAHPDWVMNFPNRPRSELRTQLVLNLAREDVRGYIFGFLDKMTSENDIRYIKWDMNRTFAEPGWPEVAPEHQKELWVKYVWNYYDILKRLRAKHPRLEIESCSGGGGRIDLAVLRYVDEVWPSDNTEAFDRLRIQEGFSEAYAAKFMSAWVTDVPNMNGRSTPLQYRFLVAMQGALGLGSNLNKFSDADAALATKMIALDKRIRETVQLGDLYRLLLPDENDTTSNEYVSKDGKHAVLFAFRHSQQYATAAPTIHLRGLDGKAVYEVDGAQFSGAYLMDNGVNVKLGGDFDSAVMEIHRIQ